MTKLPSKREYACADCGTHSANDQIVVGVDMLDAISYCAVCAFKTPERSALVFRVALGMIATACDIAKDIDPSDWDRARRLREWYEDAVVTEAQSALERLGKK